MCPAYDGLEDSPCPGWVRPRETEEEQTKFLKCVNERTECLLRNVADFADYNVRQDEWEREKIETMKREARAEGKSELEIKELDSFTTRGCKEEPALRPLEQDVLCLARYGTADRDLLATLPPGVVNLDGDFTDFPPDEWYRQRQSQSTKRLHTWVT